MNGDKKYRIILNFIKDKMGLELQFVSARKWPQSEGVLSVIHIDKDDKISDDKFQPLAEANRFSEIYIVGHSYPGKEGIFNQDNTHCFRYEWIAELLCTHIKSEDVRIKQKANDYMDSTQLSIFMIACHAGKRTGFFKKEASLAEKLFVALLNDKNNPLSVEIHASKMFVFPVPCSEKEYKSSSKKLAEQPTYMRDWHLRYVDSPYWKGGFSFRGGYAFYSIFFPSANPQGNYKQVIRRAPSAPAGYKVYPLREYLALQSAIHSINPSSITDKQDAEPPRDVDPPKL